MMLTVHSQCKSLSYGKQHLTNFLRTIPCPVTTWLLMQILFLQNSVRTILFLPVLAVRILTLKMSEDTHSEHDLMILRSYNVFNA